MANTKKVRKRLSCFKYSIHLTLSLTLESVPSLLDVEDRFGFGLWLWACLALAAVPSSLDVENRLGFGDGAGFASLDFRGDVVGRCWKSSGQEGRNQDKECGKVHFEASWKCLQLNKMWFEDV